MPMTIVVTRDVEARYRGFLTSVMLEIAPGVYVAPDLSAGVRQRRMGRRRVLVVVPRSWGNRNGLARCDRVRTPANRNPRRAAERDCRCGRRSTLEAKLRDDLRPLVL